ncbi:MAG: SDR family oxidoreductase [Gammaproteobacteria bacterium]|nr:SDR family oxidoreductase [Gammaproteobacteria bacterium]MDX2462774.1 SDR family oxidoreductase [Gammaproteobacteria bacterium]
MADNGSQRAVLITGCSSGIGECVAAGLKVRGYRVFASARQDADVTRLGEQGFEAIKLDLRDAESIKTAVDALLARTGGKLYGLFNNGAYGQPGAVEDLDTDTLRAQFETNVFGWHELTRRVLPIMRRQGYGRIIQNSSVLGFVALKWRGAYTASKFAIEGLTDTLRMELSGSGIHVSLIEPGPIESRFRENAYEAFKANIDTENSPHREDYRRVQARLASHDDTQPFTLSGDAVLKKVVHALESRRPKPRYYVTLPTYALGFLRRVLSTRWLDFALKCVSGGEHRRA